MTHWPWGERVVPVPQATAPSMAQSSPTRSVPAAQRTTPLQVVALSVASVSTLQTFAVSTKQALPTRQVPVPHSSRLAQVVALAEAVVSVPQTSRRSGAHRVPTIVVPGPQVALSDGTHSSPLAMVPSPQVKGTELGSQPASTTRDERRMNCGARAKDMSCSLRNGTKIAWLRSISYHA